MYQDIINEAKNLESIIGVCCGVPRGQELPQAASENDVLVEVLRHSSEQPFVEIDAVLHGQIDPSYELEK